LERVYTFFTKENKIWKEVENKKELSEENKIFFENLIEKIDNYYKKIKLNLVVSSLMGYINEFYKIGFLEEKYGKTFLQLLYPLAPHISEELWEYLEKSKMISESD
jgi:leucyl-tRNA synthetase